NPPGVYLWLRLFTQIVGDSSETTFRVFSFLWVLVGLIGIYVAVRRIVAPLIAFGAVLAVWCNPLVLEYAFEARAYAPWLAGSIWLAVLAARVRDSSHPWLMNM